MAEQDYAWAADVLVKMQRALPSAARDSLQIYVRLSTLVIRIATLLPWRGVSGLGPEQQATVTAAARSLLATVTRALHQPLHHLTPAFVELLRALARDSNERATEFAFVPTGRFLPGQFRTHRFADYQTVGQFLDGLARAELAYDVLVEGAHRLRAVIENGEFLQHLDQGLPLVSVSLNMWALPLLFDGMRLRRGIEIAARCGCARMGQRAPFGLDDAVNRLLGDGETCVDRDRVGRAAQFLLAAADCCSKNTDCAISARGSTGSGPPDHPSCHIKRTRDTTLTQLRLFREKSEKRCLVPGGSMRIILENVLLMTGEFRQSPGTRLALKYPFVYPCLVPCDLRTPESYDGGLLSVWDACNMLLNVHADMHAEVLPLHTLLCAVMGGVVGNLMSSDVTGPFKLHPESDVMACVQALNQEWPSAHKTAEAVHISRCEQRGRQVGATAAICDALERRVFKCEQGATPASDARADAALTMLVVSYGLGSGPGNATSKPTDGLVPLKQMYLVALQAEPGVPEGRCVVYRGRHDHWPTSPFVDGVPCPSIGAVPLECVESVWREVVGGACINGGMLFCFSRRGFEDTLVHDWLPREQVILAMRQRRAQDDGARARPVMLPCKAMKHLAQRAQQHVASTVASVDNNVKSLDGPPIVTRVLEMLNKWANCVYYSADVNPIWESSIGRFCSPTAHVVKRARE